MMVRMQIQFTEEQARELRRGAAQRGVSVAALTREAVDRLLIESGDVPTAKSTARILEMMRSGIPSEGTDVAVNHDRYLEEIYADRG